MDDVVNRLSRELVDAMATAVANDDQVEACHAKAKAAGYKHEGFAGGGHRIRESGHDGSGDLQESAGWGW